MTSDEEHRKAVEAVEAEMYPDKMRRVLDGAPMVRRLARKVTIMRLDAQHHNTMPLRQQSLQADLDELHTLIQGIAKCYGVSLDL